MGKEKIAIILNSAMSLLRTISVLVVLVAIVDQSSSVPQPTISFQELGRQKDNLIASKLNLLAPVLGIKKGIKDAKLNIAKKFLRPIAGIKRSKLLALRGLLDAKINKLGNF